MTDNRNNKEKMMVLGYFLNAFFTFGYLFVSSPWHLFVVQAGLGVAEALATPTWNALYAKHENKKQDGLQWGLAGGQGQIITGIALVIGGLIVNYFSFTTLFLTMGIVSMLAAFYQSKSLRIVHKQMKSINK